MKKNNHKKTFSGFTLVELLITVSILGIMSAVASPFVIGTQYTNEVKSNAILIEALIKKAQNLATTGNTVVETNGIPTYGYGVNFNSNHEITLFINDHEGEKYQYEAGSDTKLGSVSTNDVVELPPNIGIDSFLTNGSGTSIPSSFGANVIFLPPDGAISITDNRGIGSNSFNNEISIFLKHYDGNRCFLFNLNKTSGRFYKEKTDCP